MRNLDRVLGAGSFSVVVRRFTRRGFVFPVNDGVSERKVRVGNIRRLVGISGCRVRVRGFEAAVDGDRELDPFDREDDDVGISASDTIEASRFWE